MSHILKDSQEHHLDNNKIKKGTNKKKKKE